MAAAVRAEREKLQCRLEIQAHINAERIAKAGAASSGLDASVDADSSRSADESGTLAAVRGAEEAKTNSRGCS